MPYTESGKSSAYAVAGLKRSLPAVTKSKKPDAEGGASTKSSSRRTTRKTTRKSTGGSVAAAGIDAASVAVDIPEVDYSTLLGHYDKASKADVKAAKQQRKTQLKQEQAAWKKALERMKREQEESAKARQEDYDRRMEETGLSYNDALHDAWVQQQVDSQYMGQTMAAAGLDGNGSQTAMLAMQNNAGQLRAAAYTEKKNAMKELVLALNEGLAADRKHYSEARGKAEEAHSGRVTSIKTDYQTAIQQARQQLAKNKAGVLGKRLNAQIQQRQKAQSEQYLRERQAQQAAKK